MSMDKFILTCFGIDADVLEGLCKEFDLDWDEDEIYECFQGVQFASGNWDVAQNLLHKTLDKIIDMYEDEVDRDDFDYDFSSPSYPCFYYGKRDSLDAFNTKDELEALIKESKKRR